MRMHEVGSTPGISTPFLCVVTQELGTSSARWMSSSEAVGRRNNELKDSTGLRLSASSGPCGNYNQDLFVYSLSHNCIQ